MYGNPKYTITDPHVDSFTPYFFLGHFEHFDVYANPSDKCQITGMQIPSYIFVVNQHGLVRAALPIHDCLGGITPVNKALFAGSRRWISRCNPECTPG